MGVGAFHPAQQYIQKHRLDRHNENEYGVDGFTVSPAGTNTHRSDDHEQLGEALSDVLEEIGLTRIDERTMTSFNQLVNVQIVDHEHHLGVIFQPSSPELASAAFDDIDPRYVEEFCAYHNMGPEQLGDTISAQIFHIRRYAVTRLVEQGMEVSVRTGPYTSTRLSFPEDWQGTEQERARIKGMILADSQRSKIDLVNDFHETDRARKQALEMLFGCSPNNESDITPVIPIALSGKPAFLLVSTLHEPTDESHTPIVLPEDELVYPTESQVLKIGKDIFQQLAKTPLKRAAERIGTGLFTDSDDIRAAQQALNAYQRTGFSTSRERERYFVSITQAEADRYLPAGFRHVANDALYVAPLADAVALHNLQDLSREKYHNLIVEGGLVDMQEGDLEIELPPALAPAATPSP